MEWSMCGMFGEVVGCRVVVRDRGDDKELA